MKQVQEPPIRLRGRAREKNRVELWKIGFGMNALTWYGVSHPTYEGRLIVMRRTGASSDSVSETLSRSKWPEYMKQFQADSRWKISPLRSVVVLWLSREAGARRPGSLAVESYRENTRQSAGLRAEPIFGRGRVAIDSFSQYHGSHHGLDAHLVSDYLEQLRSIVHN